MIVFFLMTDLGIMTFWIEDGESSSQDWMVQPAWHQVLVVAARQTICRGETKTRTFFILPIVSCYMLMLNAILAVATSERRIDSPREHKK